MPRGYYRALKLAVRLDPSLRDCRLELPAAPGIPLRADLSVSVFASMFREGCIPHQRGLDVLLKRIVRQGDVVFDVGANVGYVAAVLSGLVGKDGTVVAVEPAPTTYRLLARSFGSVLNVKLVNQGLSEGVAELTFYVPELLDRASFEPIPGALAVKVPVTTGDKLAELYGLPNVIKVDTEGHEHRVFRGLSKVLRSGQPPVVIFEALSGSELEASMKLLQDLSANTLSFGNLHADGSVRPLEQKGTSDFVAWPLEAEARVLQR